MAYDRAHSHGLNDSYINEVFLTIDAHGVILNPPILIDTFPANRYADAIELAQQYRGTGAKNDSYAIVTPLYSDGCRWIDLGREIDVPAREDTTTRQQQRIEHVAAILTRCGHSAAEAGRINAGDGWNFEVRWADREYISDTDYNLVEGCQLSSSDLAKALSLAEDWAA